MIEALQIADTALFKLCNQTLASHTLDAAFAVITHKYFYLGAAAAACLYLPARYRRAGLYCALGAALAVGLADLSVARLWKPLFARPRPPFVLEGVRLVVEQGNTYSLPSSHAANAFAFAFVVLCDYKKVGALLVAVAAAVAYSRVYVGVHWPSDVVAGALWGVFVGVCVVSGRFYLGTFWRRWRFLRALKNKNPP